jgi:hypothetical protein
MTFYNGLFKGQIAIRLKNNRTRRRRTSQGFGRFCLYFTENGHR